MAFNHDDGTFDRPFRFSDRATGSPITRTDMDVQFDEVGEALEAIYGRPVEFRNEYTSVPAWTPKEGTTLLVLKGGESAYDGDGSIYVRSPNTTEDHDPPTWLVDATDTRWRRLSPLPQQSAKDATAGRLLRVGAFGLGGLLPDIGNASVTNESIAPGFYSYEVGSGSSGGPGGVTKGSIWHSRRSANSGETQLMVVEASSADAFPVGSVASRSRGSGLWGPWRNAAFQGGVLPEVGNASVTNESIQPGFYSYNTSNGSSGGPSGVSKAALWHSRRSTAGGETQFLVIEASSSERFPQGSTASRVRGTDGWTPWRNSAFLGGVLPEVGNASVTNESILPGTYSYDTAQDSSGGPSGVTKASLWHARRASSGGETQFMVIEASTSERFPMGSIASRARGTGEWSPWRNAAFQGGVLPEVGNAATTGESIQPGFYSYSTADGSSGGPSGVTKGSLLHARRYANGGETQLMIIEASTSESFPAGSLASRARGSGSWGPWRNSAFLGGSLPEVGNASVTNESILPGLYSYDTAQGSAGAPSGVTKGAIWHSRRAVGGGETQLLIVEVATNLPAGSILTRARTTGAWGRWLPETGSNANGTYRLHPNGRVECFRDVPGATRNKTADSFGLFYSEEIELDFAWPMVADPEFAGVSKDTTPFGFGFLTDVAASSSAWTLRFARVADWASASTPGLTLYATGRWY
jgi:hypothetical protein